MHRFNTGNHHRRRTRSSSEFHDNEQIKIVNGTSVFRNKVIMFLLF